MQVWLNIMFSWFYTSEALPASDFLLLQIVPQIVNIKSDEIDSSNLIWAETGKPGKITDILRQRYRRVSDNNNYVMGVNMGNKGCWQPERKERGGDRIDRGWEHGESESGEIEIGKWALRQSDMKVIIIVLKKSGQNIDRWKFNNDKSILIFSSNRTLK